MTLGNLTEADGGLSAMETAHRYSNDDAAMSQVSVMSLNNGV